MTQAEQVAAIQGRLDAATPGPWKAQRRHIVDEMTYSERNKKGELVGYMTAVYATHVSGPQSTSISEHQPLSDARFDPNFVAPNATFIANAPQDIASLLKWLGEAEAAFVAQFERTAEAQVELAELQARFDALSEVSG